MKTNLKRIIPVLAMSSIVLTGCFKKEEVEPPPPPQDKPFSVSELKEKYGEKENKDILPMYNISPKEELELQFASYLGDIPIQNVLSVHTDPSASIDSMIDIDAGFVNKDVGSSKVTVKPLKGVLNNQTGSWGNAPMLYLRLEYDLDSDKPLKLEKPIIIPFTVKSSVKAPDLQAVRGANGVVELKWSKVQGADSYLVYSIRPTSLEKELKRPTSLDAFRGYEIRLVDKTKNTTFNDWGKDGKKGIYTNTYKDIVYQNKGFKGDYFVVAVDGKKQSLASTIVSSTQYLNTAPYQLVENVNNTSYENIRSMPKTVTVEMLDGTTVERKVVYNTSKLKDADAKNVPIPFTVYGTVFKGVIKVDKLSKGDKEVLARANNDYLDVYLTGNRNKIKKYVYDVVSPIATDVVVQDKEVSSDEKATSEETPSVSDTESSSDFSDFEKSDSDSKEPSDDKESNVVPPVGLFMQHKANSYAIIESSNKRKVVEPAMMEEYGVKLNVNSAVEEYIGLSLLNGEGEISLSAFPSVQTYRSLTDTLNTVLAQNPLLLGVKSWTYDYKERVLIVDYTMTSQELRSEQENLLKAVKGYISEEKVSTLAPDAVYDKIVSMVDLVEKVEDTKKGEATKKGDDNKKGEDAKEVSAPKGVSDATGVWLYGVANSEGMAKGYKLLADMVGVESVSVKGEYNLKPHWWNMVKSDGQWLNLDVSLNDKTVGIPYKVYLSDDYVAMQSGLVRTDGYWYTNSLLQFANEQGLYDFYARNGLMVESVEAYAFKLNELLGSGNTKVVMRMDRKLDSRRLYDATGSAIQQVVPDKLNVAKFTESGNFVVLDMTQEDKPEESKDKDKAEEVSEVEGSASSEPADESKDKQ